MTYFKTLFKYLCITSFFFSFSQDKFTYDALTIPVEFKEKANAVVRYEKQTLDILDYDEIKITTKRVVTVFNKYGKRHVGAYQIYNQRTDIKNMEAHIYDALGEEIKKVKERDFIDESAVGEVSIYDDDRVKYLDYIPVDYPYTVEFDSEVIYSSTAFVPYWQPLESYYLSVQHSEYEVNNPNDVPLKTQKQNFDNYEIKEISDLHYVVNNVKGVKYEAFAPKIYDIAPKFRIALEKFQLNGVDGLNTNWQQFGKWVYTDLLTGTDAVPQETLNEVKRLTAGVEDELERAKIVYNYMQDRTRYISVQIDIGSWKPMLAEDVDRLGYGDCKALTNYTKALLEHVGVESYYTLVYGGDDIRHIDSEFSAAQGNHAILTIPTEEDYVFLECTSQTNPFGFIAGFTDDRDVLLVKPEGGELVHTTTYSAEENLKKTEAKIQMSADGQFTSTVNITTTGYPYNLREGIENQNLRDQKLFYKDYWSNINNLDVIALHIKNDKDAVELSEEIQLAFENYASKSGKRFILQPNFFSRNIEIPTRYRKRDLDFIINRSVSYEDTYELTFPEGISIEALSEGQEITSKYGTYKTEISQEEHSITYKRTLTIFKGNYSKSEYKDFRSFYKKIARSDNSKMVLIHQ